MIFNTISVQIEDTLDDFKRGKVDVDFTLTEEDFTVIGDLLEMGAEILETAHKANGIYNKKEIAMGLILSFALCLDYYKRVENGEIFDDKH